MLQALPTLSLIWLLRSTYVVTANFSYDILVDLHVLNGESGETMGGPRWKTCHKDGFSQDP
jgi:hypothetical protein